MILPLIYFSFFILELSEHIKEVKPQSLAENKLYFVVNFVESKYFNAKKRFHGNCITVSTCLVQF